MMFSMEDEKYEKREICGFCRFRAKEVDLVLIIPRGIWHNHTNAFKTITKEW